MELSVGVFQKSNAHKFTWFGNLPTPRSYWFVLITQRNNTNKEEEKTFLNSTLHTQALNCSLSFLSVFSLFSATISQLFNERAHTHTHTHTHTQMGVKGYKSCHDLCHRLCPPPCVKWEIRYSHLHMVGHCLSPLSNNLPLGDKQ